jgi:hypothetical protein
MGGADVAAEIVVDPLWRPVESEPDGINRRFPQGLALHFSLEVIRFCNDLLN